MKPLRNSQDSSEFQLLFFQFLLAMPNSPTGLAMTGFKLKD